MNHPISPSCNRRSWLTAVAVGLSGVLSGCVDSVAGGKPDLVWGRRGQAEGRFQIARAIEIDADDRLYIVDKTGRIQVFDVDGNYQGSWKTPETANGRPTGITMRPADQRYDRPLLLVADTHYYRILAYELDGRLVEEMCLRGTPGFGPGEFAFVTEAVCDSDGCMYVSEYGDSDRVQKFDPSGQFMTQWGSTGPEPGNFIQPRSMVIDNQTLYVADSCNHRIQRFDLSTPTPSLIDIWGTQGSGLGQFHYPYDLAIIPGETGISGNHGVASRFLVCEYGNQRVQILDAQGNSEGTWGTPGHEPGQLHDPWGAAVDSQGRIHVLDSYNHRIQRFSVDSVIL